MSKGLGKIEREIIEYLQGLEKNGMPSCVSLAMLCRLLYVPSMVGIVMAITPSQQKEYSSLKRASKSLAREGLIKRVSNARSCLINLCVPLREIHLKNDKEVIKDG